MARPTTYLNYLKEKDKGVQLVAHCPVTCGRPTRMTAQGFARCCAANRAIGTRPEDDGVTFRAIMGVKKRLNVCAACRGEKRPAELEIIPLPVLQAQVPAQGPVVKQQEKTTEVEMATKNKNQKCGICGELKVCFTNHGMTVCGSCAKDQSSVKNHPERLLELMERLIGREKMTLLFAPYLPEQVSVQMESKSLQEIAEIVGYTPEDIEGLIVQVKNLVADHQALLRADRWKPSPDVIRALELPEGPTSWPTIDQIEQAAMRHAAALEDIKRCLGIDCITQDVVGTVSALTAAFERYKERAESLTRENGVLADRISELEQTQGVYAQDGELVLSSLKGSSNLDSHLLDLALDAWRGEVTGLDPDRIAMLREAV